LEEERYIYINHNDLHKSAFRSVGHIYITVNPCVHKTKVYINSGHCHWGE
jgi:hypothetical protein